MLTGRQLNKSPKVCRRCGYTNWPDVGTGFFRRFCEGCGDWIERVPWWVERYGGTVGEYSVTQAGRDRDHASAQLRYYKRVGGADDEEELTGPSRAKARKPGPWTREYLLHLRATGRGRRRAKAERERRNGGTKCETVRENRSG